MSNANILLDSQDYILQYGNEVKLTRKVWLLSPMEARQISQNFCQFLLLVTWGMLINHSFQVLPSMFIYIGIQILLWSRNCKDSTTGKKVNYLNKCITSTTPSWRTCRNAQFSYVDFPYKNAVNCLQTFLPQLQVGIL